MSAIPGPRYAQRDSYWSRRSAPLSLDTVALINRIISRDIPARQEFDARISSFVEELRTSVGPYWLTMAASMALEAATAESDGSTDFVDRFGVEAQIQFLISACSDTDYVHDYVPPDAVQSAFDCINEIFELEAAATYCEFPGDSFSDRSSRGLVIEAIYDRFEFYGRHAAEIKRATLDPLRAEFVGHLGWSIDEYWAIADAVIAVSNQKWGALAKRFRADPRALDSQIREHGEWETQMSLGAEICFHDVEVIAQSAGLDSTLTSSLLDQLSLPTDGSTLVSSARTVSPMRVHPAVRMRDGRYFVPFPHLWKQDTFRVVDAYTSTFPKLRTAWLRARDDGTEELVAARMTSLFGSQRVLRSATHLHGEVQGETDVLINLDDDAVLIECKAHTLTAAGRRGAPARVETKTAEILEKAFQQIKKGRAHLRAGLPIAQHGKSAQVVGLGADAELLGLVVSFERIDPLFMHTGLRAFAEEPAVAMSLADLLSVTDMLQWASAFYQYLSQRSKILDLSKLRATTEQDFLGMFLVDQRLENLIAMTEDVDGVWVDGYGPSLNEYLAVSLKKFKAPPLKFPPRQVLVALSDVLLRPSHGWARTVRAAHSVPGPAWRSLKGMLRGAASPARSKRWTSPDGSLMIEVAEAPELSAVGTMLRVTK